MLNSSSVKSPDCSWSAPPKRGGLKSHRSLLADFWLIRADIIGAQLVLFALGWAEVEGFPVGEA